MLAEEWVELIKNALSPSAFREVGVLALHVLRQGPVKLVDQPGDGGVDAWIELPSGRVPVQFYAGRSEPWEAKLEGISGRTSCSGRASGCSSSARRPRWRNAGASPCDARS